MEKYKRVLSLLLGLSMIICMFTACGQSAQPAEEGKYTLENIRDQVVGLNEQMEIDNAIVYGDAEDLSDRVGVITFNFSDVNSYLVAEQLSKNYGIATRRGAFCANPYVWRLYGLSDEEVRNFAECSDVNTPGMIRVSFGIYNTEEEVDYLLKVLPKAIKQAKKENKENFNLAEPKY